MRVLVTALLCLVLAGCAPAAPTSDMPSNLTQLPNARGMYRYHDDEPGVVCWMFKIGYVGGIDCLPISETKLGKE